MIMRLSVLLLIVALPLAAATKLTVSVVQPKTGIFVTGLKAADFTVLDDKTPRAVEEVEPTAPGPLDIMLLLDTSLVGGVVQPTAASLIGQLQDKDQMAIVGYHSSADLLQQFTSSKEMLTKAIGTVKYGNTPQVLDAVTAVIRDGFEDAVYRRVIVILTTGLDAGSRTSEKEVVRLARRSGVSIYPVYMSGAERGMFETLARQTGGATFNLQDLRKDGLQQPGPRVFETIRQTYTVTVAGNLAPSDRLKVEVRSPQKLFVSVLPAE